MVAKLIAILFTIDLGQVINYYVYIKEFKMKANRLLVAVSYLV